MNNSHSAGKGSKNTQFIVKKLFNVIYLRQNCISLCFLCKYPLSRLPSIRLFPLLTIKLKAHIKQSNKKVNNYFVLCQDIDQ